MTAFRIRLAAWRESAWTALADFGLDRAEAARALLVRLTGRS